MTTVGNLLAYLEQIMPYELAENWDNCGLLAGDKAHPVTKVLCALDVTEIVVREAKHIGAQLIVAHHPLIFTSINRVTADNTVGRILRTSIQNNISIICMHTNADCANGGVNDALAQALGLQNIIPMEAGENGMLGRVGDLPQPMEQRAFALYVKNRLHAGGVRFVYGRGPIRRVAVGGGACGKMMDAALAKGADAFVIGDSSYDIMQRAESSGLTMVDAGHYSTENPMVPVFASKIHEEFPEVEAKVSTMHMDVIHFV